MPVGLRQAFFAGDASRGVESILLWDAWCEKYPLDRLTDWCRILCR